MTGLAKKGKPSRTANLPESSDLDGANKIKQAIAWQPLITMPTQDFFRLTAFSAFLMLIASWPGIGCRSEPQRAAHAADWRLQVGDLLAKGDCRTALERLQNEREHAETLAWTRLFVTACQVCATDFHDPSYAVRGIGVLDNAIPKYPDHPRLLNHRAFFRLLAGEPEAAEEDWRAVIVKVNERTARHINTAEDQEAVEEARRNLEGMERPALYR